MAVSSDDQSRKIQEIANKLGWDSDINALVKRIKQLDNGLIQEDEFIYLLNWSKKCSLIHKLDQFKITPKPQAEFTIPDLFVVFEVDGERKPYFIEIKTSKKSHLSWTERYYNGLIEYSKATNIPILIAWKWRSFDIWVLFELKHFVKGNSNYKMDLGKAYQVNCMSLLAGDFFIAPYDEIALHLKYKKLDIAETSRNGTVWNAFLDSFYIIGNEGKEVHDVDSGLVTFLLSFPMEVKDRDDGGYIVRSFIPSPNKSAFAQSVLIRLVRALTEGAVNWLDKIKKNEYPIRYEQLLIASKLGIEKEIIRNILFTKPSS